MLQLKDIFTKMITYIYCTNNIVGLSNNKKKKYEKKMKSEMNLNNSVY